MQGSKHLTYDSGGLFVYPAAGYFKSSLVILLALLAPKPLPFFLPPDVFFPQRALKKSLSLALQPS